MNHDDGIGVGPHPEPWPDDPRLDPQLLADGDRRNVVDRYRYWSVEAIVADLDERRHPYHVAVENWSSDLNIGTVVRNANAFGAASVTIVGKRRWNRRGAMVTDRYQHVRHVATVDELVTWADGRGTGRRRHRQPSRRRAPRDDHAAQALRAAVRPGGTRPVRRARAAAELVCSIAQVGSTRSINAGVASGIAMHTWLRQHALPG